jgi:hypothetical protein
MFKTKITAPFLNLIRTSLYDGGKDLSARSSAGLMV